MKKQNFLTRMLLLFALIVGSVNGAWAEYVAAYTFSITKPNSGAVTDYTKTGDMVIDGITWNIPGNWYATGALRLGGKSISKVDRTITGKGTIDDAISKITFNHNGVTSDNLKVNSVTLTVASNSTFTSIVDTKVVNPTISKNTSGSFDFTPTSDPWPAGCYYKIDVNLSNSNSTNYAFVVNSIVFYKTVEDRTSTATEIISTGITNRDLKNGTTAGKLSANVTAGGSSVGDATISWMSDDTDIAFIDGSGNVTLVGAGKATITATYAGDAIYASSYGTYDLIVTDSRTATATSIDYSGINNTDMKNGSVAGTLSASVTAGGEAVAGAIVTWKSSDDKVATIDASGKVTLVGVGTATITAIYSANSTYQASSDTYEIEVTDSRYIIINDWSSLFGVAANAGSLSGAALKDYNGTINNVSVEYIKGGASNMYIKTNDLRIYQGISLSFTAPVGYAIKEIEFEGTTSSDKAPIADVGEFSYSTKIWTGFSKALTLSRGDTNGGYTKFTKAIITLAQTEPIEVSEAGFATYVSDADLDYSDLAVKAYKASVKGTDITFKMVTTVPAGEGVLLQGAADTYNVPVAASAVAAWADSENAFIPGTGAAVDSGSGPYNYILNNGANGVGFYKANGQNVAKNRAYLQSTVLGARLSFSFDDEVGEATGISEVKNVKADAAIYNLNGVRVKNMTKGLYIMNGKKVVLK